jgi:hypothetical protein
MRKSIALTGFAGAFLAAFNTVLVAGFLALPTAHAGPLCPPSMAINPTVYQKCLVDEQNQNACGDAAGCGGLGIPGLVHQACGQAGNC